MEVEPAVQGKQAEDDGSSDDSMSSVDAKQDVAAARKEVEESGTFEAHRKLVSALRAAGDDFTALRAARAAFAEAYPLVPSLWLEWCEDELALEPSADVRRFVVHDVLCRGLRDYLSISLASRLLEIQTERVRAQECGADEVKGTIIELKSRGALVHFSRAEQLWRTVFELMKLCGMDDSKAKKEMHSLPIKLYDDDAKPSEEVEDLVVSCGMFEDKLAESGRDPSKETGVRDDALKSRYKSYAAYLENLSVPAARCVWERCVAECFLDVGMWRDYAKFCREKLGPDDEREVLLRSSRNVPSDLGIWRELVFNIERRAAGNLLNKESAASDLSALLECVHKYVYTSVDWDGAMRLGLAFITCYRSLQMPQEIREAVFACLGYNEEGSEQWASCKLAIASVCVFEKEIEEVVKHVSEVLEKRKTDLSVWIRGIQLINRVRTSDEKVRELYREGIKSLTNRNDVAVLGGAWMDFESFATGDVTRHEDVLKTIDNRILVLPKTDSSKLKQKTKSKPPKPRVLSQQSADVGRKRKKPEIKRRRKEVVPDSTVSVDANGKPEMAEAKPEPQYEVNTVFINNLAFKATEEAVRKKFAECGAIKDVRIPKRGDGAPKGMAYVEFEDDKSVELALKLHETQILGRTIWVRRSKPPRRPPRPRGGAPSSKGRRSARPLAMEGDTVMTEVTTEETKTQDDFRKMLLGIKE